VNLVVSLGSNTVIHQASSSIAVSGTVTGGLVNLQSSDNIYQTIREIESGGSRTKRFSFLEHKWAFTVGSNATLTFQIEAHHTANSEGDSFGFAYSTNGVNGTYQNMLTVTKTSDNNTMQSFVLPAGISGTVHVRVLDLNRTAGRRTLDTLSIDRMVIQAVTNLPGTIAGRGGAGSGSSAYQTWAAIHSPDSGPADDFDQDGVSNGIEYLLGGTKDSNDLALLPAIRAADAGPEFHFQRKRGAEDGIAVVLIEVGDDLNGWEDSYRVGPTTATSTPGVMVMENTPTGYDTITLALPAAAQGRKFARLNVTTAE
jgi:hypothetical protein